MRRIAIFLLLLACFSPVQAENAALWEQVSLFDWIYKGEKPYEYLKQAAESVGEHGWVAQRLETGDKVPQASARELGQTLADNPKVDPNLRIQLKKYFADETEQMAQGNQADISQRTQKLDAALADASHQLDDLEASLYKNNYGKGSQVSSSAVFYAGDRADNPSGMIQGQEHNYIAGGLDETLSGSLGQNSYSISLGVEYVYGASNQATSTILSPSTLNYPEPAAPYDMYGEHINTGLTFEAPDIGWNIVLGSANAELSPLLFATILPINRDSFSLDVLANYQAPKTVATQELNYPAQISNFTGLYLTRQGSTWWWPFTNTQLVYYPDSSFWQSYDEHLDNWAARVDEDFGPRGHWLDGLLVYGMVDGSYNDTDQLVGSNQGYNLNTDTANGSITSWGDAILFPQQTVSEGWGLDFRTTSGTKVHVDGAASSYSWQWPGGTQSYSDTACLATVVQPVGPVSLALTLGQAGPHFLSSPRNNARNQFGATQDSIANVYNNTPGASGSQGSVNGGAELWQLGSYQPTGTAPANSWVSLIDDPQVLTNNNRLATLKAEWHGSFVSLGLYDGLQEQINPSDANVITQPYIEGSQEDGYGWFRVFGNSFYAPQAVNYPAVAPPAQETGGYLMANNFSRPSNGTANFGKPGMQAIPVDWQELTQLEPYSVELTTLLSQNGVGDNNVMADSVKTLNFAGGNILFDLADLFNLKRKLEVTVICEDRDLATQPGLPKVGSANLFNQQFEVANLTAQVSDTVTLLGMAGYETWQTQQSYFPLETDITETGIGADWKADVLVSTLVFSFRTSVMNYYDQYFSTRDFSLVTVSLGTFLTY